MAARRVHGRSAPGDARAQRLAAFSADALDWPAVLALFEPYARSPLGRRALAELAPREDADARDALARLGELEQADTGLGEPPLGGVADAPSLVARAEEEQRALPGVDLAAIAAFLRTVDAVREWLVERRGALPHCARLASGLQGSPALRAELENGLDAQGEPRDGASPELARLRADARRVAAELERTLADVVRRPSTRGAFADGHGGQLHPRHGRLTLAIKAGHRGQVPGAVIDRSASGETLYVEPREVADLGNRLVELGADEAREASRLFVVWTRAVLGQRAVLAGAAQALAELELALVGRDFARELGGRAPLVPGERGAASELVLRGARHPLLAAQERAGRLARAVPIDLRLGGAFDQLLVTGPNTGGKTLVLKTAGVAVLSARSGLPVLADAGTTVPLYRGLAVDIGDEQEVEQSLSTFASHVVRLSAGLARAAPDVLFLLDEVGGATDPEEGAVLGEALLEHLLARRVPTLATTHLARLVEYAWRHERVENASVEFDTESLAPTYRLLVGTPGRSQALAIARRLGLPREIVERAEARSKRPEGEAASLIAELGRARRAAEEARSAAEARLADVEERGRALAREEAELAARREHLLAAVDAELERRLAFARPALERVAALAPQLPAPAREALAEPLAALGAALASGGISAYRDAFFARLRKGDAVWLPRYGRRCPVVRVDADRRRLRVRLGQRELDVDFDDAAAFEAL